MDKDVFPLTCGLYGDQARKPPVQASSVAVRVDQKPSPTMYIALNIRGFPGREFESGVYGIRKVTISSKGFEDNIMDKVVKLVPADADSAVRKGGMNSLFVSPTSEQGGYSPPFMGGYGDQNVPST